MGSKSIKYNKSNGGLMIDYLTFIEELKTIKKSIKSTLKDEIIEMGIQTIIDKYEHKIILNEKEENNEPSRT